MNKRVDCRLLTVALAAVTLCACADDVAPGYRIEKQDVGVNYADGTVHIRAEYRLRNTGSEPLGLLRISLAAVNPGAATNMRIYVDGAQMKWAGVEEGGERALEVKFSPAWERRTRKQLRLEYQFATTLRGSGADPAKAQSFQLVPGSWSPELLPPPGILSKGGNAPKKWDMNVTVPAEFRVRAAGKPRGSKNRTGAVEHRFQQEKAHGYAFVMAGPYEEIRVESSGFNIYFWGGFRVGQSQQNAQHAGERLAKTMLVYREWLGPLENDLRDLYVVQGTVRYILGGSMGSRPGFAPGVINDPMIVRPPGPGFNESACIADEWLAGMWLFWLARPERALNELGEQLTKHFAQVLPHGCGYGEQTREQEIARLRNGFAAATKNFENEKGPMKESFRRERDGYRMRLQVFAMEERAGREKFQKALRRMLQALRGGRWTQADLRSALEGETGEDWAAFFRAWADDTRLPAE